MFAIVKVRLGTDEKHQKLDERKVEEAAELWSLDSEEEEAEEQVPEETSGCASSQKCCNLL